MKTHYPDFYTLPGEIQYNLALCKLNKYLPRALRKASRGELSNTLNRRVQKWSGRLARGAFSLHPELRDDEK